MRAGEDRPDRDAFYVGYLTEAPPALRTHLRRVCIGLLAVGGILAVAAARLQRPFASATFEFGITREFAGTVRTHPVPRLEVSRRNASSLSEYLLVARGKHGAGDLLSTMDGRTVRATGSLIYRGNTTMLELADAPVVNPSEGGVPGPSVIELGRFTLTGEIVDGKCWLGVMNPGSLKTHRACAIRCLSGGAPALFVVRDGRGAEAQLLLLTTGGSPYGESVQPWVAEPVRMSGLVQREGDLLFLRTDPSTWERVP